MGYNAKVTDVKWELNSKLTTLSFNNGNILRIFAPNSQSIPMQQSQPKTLMPSCPLPVFFSSSLCWNLGKAQGPHNPPPLGTSKKMAWEEMNNYILSLVLKPTPPPNWLFACHVFWRMGNKCKSVNPQHEAPSIDGGYF